MDFMRSFIESYLPPNYSEQGYVIDDLIIWVHYLMLVLFVGWGIYFVYTLFRFRASKNTKANYKGVTSHYSTYVEFGIIAVEVALLFGLAIPNWQKLKLDIPEPQEIAIEDSTIKIDGKLLILFFLKKLLFFSLIKRTANKFCFSASFTHKFRSS